MQAAGTIPQLQPHPTAIDAEFDDGRGGVIDQARPSLGIMADAMHALT